MLKRRYLLITLLFLLIPVGITAAQSSINTVTQRTVLAGGSTADSASFSVKAVIGQPMTDHSASANYKVSGGFLFPDGKGFGADDQLWLPLIEK